MTALNKQAQGPVSLERLHQISEILSKAAAQSDGSNLGYAMAEAVKVIDGVIASFGAEPDYIRYDCGCCGWETIDEWRDNDVCPKCNHKPMGKTELYAAQPAPVVPETLPCPVHLEPGLKFGKGVRTQCMLDALRRRAEYYAELETMTPEQRAEHDAGIAEFKAMLQAGNSPATPDGWIPVSERMPEDGEHVIVFHPRDGVMQITFFFAYGKWWDAEENDGGLSKSYFTHWMPLPAAPQQEVK